MANAVTAYRDSSLSERGTDANMAAILAYLEDQPAPQPLPPLAARRVGSQNLPPVRNILSQPEDWTQAQQISANKSKRNNVVHGMVR